MISRLVQRLRAWADGFLSDNPLHRPRAALRLTTMGLVLLALLGAPAVVGALPVSSPKISPDALLARVKASATVPYEAYAEARGALDLPDINTLGSDVSALLSERSRLRVWYASPTLFRVDKLAIGGESDDYVDGQTHWTWDSGPRRAVRTTGSPQLPMPEPPDTLPGPLARHLLESATSVTAAPSRRIAGQTAAGLIWHPNDLRSIIGEVRVWADPDTGLPLRVELRPIHSEQIAFESSILNLHLRQPAAADVHFDAAATPRVDLQETLPPQEQDLQSLYLLPPTLTGLPRRSEPRPFVATYGEGAAIVAVAPMDDVTALTIRQQIDSPSHPPLKGFYGEASVVTTPILNALVVAAWNRGYVLVGPVTTELLESIAVELVYHPPPTAPPQQAVGPA